MILSRVLFLSKKVGILSKKISSTLSIIKKSSWEDPGVIFIPYIDSSPLIQEDVLILENLDYFSLENGDYLEVGG
jgi:hypothetical protein